MTVPLLELRDTSDAPLTSAEATISGVGVTALPTVRVAVVGTWTTETAAIGVMCVDGAPVSLGTERGLAGAVVDAKWIEAKIGAGAWTPVGGHPIDAGAAVLAIADPAPATYVDVEMRINAPAAAEIGSLVLLPFVYVTEA